MHQPFYKDTRSRQYSLPWVRLHAVKDYLHIASLIADYPTIHQTINIVPSLAEQLREYGEGTAIDSIGAICFRAVTHHGRLSDADKRAVLAAFFSINWEHFVLPVPRFAQLARVREAVNGDVGLLSDQYFLDLMVWYNLAWIDPTLRASTPRLSMLVARGSNFSVDDLETVSNEHRRICSEVIPYYHELERRGQVELTTSPYFHPILPLLIDTNSGRESSPHLPLPQPHFAFPDDARRQIVDAIEFHQSTFGHPPRGMWPSEGAVSQAVVQLAGEFPQIEWIASDEQVLGRALGRGFERDGVGNLRDPRHLYQPYVSAAGGPVLFFRDQTLSDRVGFVYQSWNAIDAANDLVERLLSSARILERSEDPAAPPPIVSIILDGENCWEFYSNNGENFLRHLFERLDREPLLKTVTPSEYLDRLPGGRARLAKLDHIPAASWIASNLETWIGEADQNRAWEYLGLARSRLQAWDREHGVFRPTTQANAWHALRVAEGSDWFWWYYSRNRIGGEDAFDERFRQQLANIYLEIDADVPDWLSRPISGQLPARRRSATAPITVDPLSAEHDAASVWSGAAFLEPDLASGSMQLGHRIFRRLYYGSNRDNYYFRIEYVPGQRSGTTSLFFTRPSASRTDSDAESGQHPIARATKRLDLSSRNTHSPELLRHDDDESWTREIADIAVAVGDDSVELKLPWRAIQDDDGAPIWVTVAQVRDGQVIEVLPTTDPIEIAGPSLADLDGHVVGSVNDNVTSVLPE